MKEGIDLFPHQRLGVYWILRKENYQFQEDEILEERSDGGEIVKTEDGEDLPPLWSRIVNERNQVMYIHGPPNHKQAATRESGRRYPCR